VTESQQPLHDAGGLDDVTKRVIVEADGGSRGNPGPAGYGAVVRAARTGAVLAERKEYLGIETNNVAEYRGLIAGLQAAAELGAVDVTARMDSKLVVEQMSGRWQIKNEVLRRLASEANKLRRNFGAVAFEWVPRERNRAADRLANEAMDAGSGLATVSPTTAADVGASAIDDAVTDDTAPIDDAMADDASTAIPTWGPPTSARTRLVLVRHGATAHSTDHRFSGRNELPLSDEGRAQAAALASRLAADSMLGQVTTLVTSPLRRAVQTADTIAHVVGCEVEQLDALAELDFGEWEGLTLADAEQRWPAEFARWLTRGDAAPPGGESFAQLERRVRRARSEMIRKFSEGVIVVVTHVTPIKTLLRLALDAPTTALFRLHLDIASISVADYYQDGAVSVRLVNDIGHLTSR
jgi:ribonuclease H / adenosylcobalamin/alpha-ribazole phosphatase